MRSPKFREKSAEILFDVQPHRACFAADNSSACFSTTSYRGDGSVVAALYPRPQFAIFFLWGYTKDTVRVPPLPEDLGELKNRITDAINSITLDMLQNVCEEFD